MKDDPIVEEVRRAREQIAAEHNYDLKALCETMQRKTEEARKAGHTVVSFPPRPANPKAKSARGR